MSYTGSLHDRDARYRLRSGMLLNDGRPRLSETPEAEIERRVHEHLWDRPRGGHHLTALVGRRAGVTLKALAQIGDQLVVGHELAIVVGDLVRRERLEAFRGRHVDARRERAEATLLLPGQEPCEIKLRGIGMRRILEDATGKREYRRPVDRRPNDLQLSLAPERPDGRRGIESGDILAGGDAAGDRKMALDEVRLGASG